MFFNALNYKLEPQSICVTLEKQKQTKKNNKYILKERPDHTLYHFNTFYKKFVIKNNLIISIYTPPLPPPPTPKKKHKKTQHPIIITLSKTDKICSHIHYPSFYLHTESN